MKSDSCGQCSMQSMCPEKLCIFSIKRSWAHPFSQQTGHKKNGNKVIYVFHRNHNYCPTNIHEDVTKEEMRHVGFVASCNNLLHRAVDTVFTKGWVNHAGEVLMSHCGEQGDSLKAAALFKVGLSNPCFIIRPFLFKSHVIYILHIMLWFNENHKESSQRLLPSRYIYPKHYGKNWRHALPIHLCSDICKELIRDMHSQTG